MSAERDKMITSLKQLVVPVLKARGFKGSFPHFRRIHDKGIHLLSFQFDKWGGGFVVEVASCSLEGIDSGGPLIIELRRRIQQDYKWDVFDPPIPRGYGPRD